MDQQIFCIDKDAQGMSRFFFVRVSIYLHLNDIIGYWNNHSTKNGLDDYPNWDAYFSKIIFDETMLAVYNAVIGHISGSGDVVTVSMDRSYSLQWVEMAMSDVRWSELKEEQKYNAIDSAFIKLIR